MERNDGVVVSPPTELEDTRPVEPHLRSGARPNPLGCAYGPESYS
jgi:hypothetical protein